MHSPSTVPRTSAGGVRKAAVRCGPLFIAVAVLEAFRRAAASEPLSSGTDRPCGCQPIGTGVQTEDWLYTPFDTSRCRIEECRERPVNFQRLCHSHANHPLWKEFGSWRRCRVADCGRPADVPFGLCAAHYVKASSGSTTLLLQPPRQARRATYAESGKPPIHRVLEMIADVDRREIPLDWARAYLRSQCDVSGLAQSR